MKIKKMATISVMTLIIFTISCSLSCSVYAEKTEEFHKTFELTSGSPVSVENTNGSITITAWDKDYVDVWAEKKTKRSSSELDDVEIVITQDDNLIIKTDYLKRNAKVSVTYKIKVPGNIPLKLIKTTNGSVTLEGTSGDVVVKSTNGQIKAHDTKGSIDAKTTNGSITLEDASEVISARTTNGSIDATFREMSSDINLTTTNGSILLRFPADLNADLEMKTTNGSIKANQIQILVDEMSKRYIKGKLGDGGNELNLRTTNGNIKLEKM
ncbi:DUF4097 family beta strand repeat-containing protein [Candidatus Latescibacterota bacterium]